MADPTTHEFRTPSSNGQDAKVCGTSTQLIALWFITRCRPVRR